MTLARSSYAFTVMLGCLLCGDASALSTDDDQPIFIEADRLDVDEPKGVSTYRGNVRYTQGSIVVTADVVIIYFDVDRNLEKVDATGQPVRFQQQMDDNGEILRGQAKDIEYTVKQDYWLLTGAAHFWQCGDEFSGNQIEYYATKELVKARKAASGDERVQVKLQPRPKNGEQKQSPCVNEAQNP